MIHLPDIIRDLGIILITAGMTTMIFKKLKQPVVLGYIIAGFLVGPHFTFFPTIIDNESVSVWAELGVIFLLFSLGLEFSFKKLAKVGGSASITAIVEVISMLGLGYLTGVLLGWNTIDSIFLGGILSISSTTIIIRAFEELQVKTQKFAGVVFGALIVEDLVAILLLVLLSTVAVSQQFAGSELLYSLLKLFFMLALWFMAGIFILPTFFRKIKKLLSDETLLVVSCALCLMMVLLSTQAGFSPALGAFIMGSLLAETNKAEKIEHLINPVKDFFAAVFFVSVGMLLNPTILVDYAWPVVIITLVTVFGKAISSSLGALISGQPLKTSIQTGLSLSQIGEFSFIIATLGLTLKVTSEFLYPIAVTVSAITTFTTPYLIRFSPNVYRWVDGMLPERWKNALNRYSNSTQTMTSESNWRKITRAFIMTALTNIIICIGILFLSSKYLVPFIGGLITADLAAKIVSAVITLAVMSPFLWALAAKKLKASAYSELWLNKRYNRGPLVLMEIVRVAMAAALTGFALQQIFNSLYTWLVTVPLTLVVFFIFSKKLQQFYQRIELRFLRNLNAREDAAKAAEKATAQQKKQESLLPWDLHVTQFIVDPGWVNVGKTLHELQFREKYGVNVVSIDRGSRKIHAPVKTEIIYPADKLEVIGTDEQIEQFSKVMQEVQGANVVQDVNDNVSLQQFIIQPGSPISKQSIRSAGIREKTSGLVVGIERNGEAILNPSSEMILLPGDLLWIVGLKNSIKNLR